MFALDFFCGAGGLTRGLLNSGISVLAGIDSDLSCQKTYEFNNKPAKFIRANINKLEIKSVQALIGMVASDDLLFAACPPCQPFASLNKNGRNEDAKLLGRFAIFVEEIQPKYVFIENVAGLARVKGYSTYERFKNTLKNSGYYYSEDVLDAKYFGVPQTRRRLILIATKDLKPTMPPITHGPGRLPFVNVEDVIRKYPPILAGGEDASYNNHKAASIFPVNLKRLRATPHDGGSRTDWPDSLWLACHKDGHEGHSDVYGRMKWAQPSPTLTCRCYSISNGRYGHPEQDRAISFREAARLQSFDDEYVFFAKSHEDYGAQIGNAVPVKLAEAIGRHIICLSQMSESSQNSGC